MGGVTLSEMRSAYEVTQAAKNWEIIVGKSDYFLICDPSAQNQLQFAKFGFKILSKNRMRGIFSNWYITTNFIFNIFILYEKRKNLIKRNLEGFRSISSVNHTFDAFLSQKSSTYVGIFYW